MTENNTTYMDLEPGWYEWFILPSTVKHIAHVQEEGGVYLPEERTTYTQFTQAVEEGAARMLKRYDRSWQNEVSEMQVRVEEFRRVFGLHVAERPRALSTSDAEMHIKMIRDEFEKELVPALLQGDIVETYDAGIDVIYYLIGMLSDSGMNLAPGFNHVHASNMSKLDPVTKQAIRAVEGDGSGEPVGKVLKGPNYFKPNLIKILTDQL